MMYECHSDVYGMMPCDYGCVCDKCSHMDVKLVVAEMMVDDDWYEEGEDE